MLLVSARPPLGDAQSWTVTTTGKEVVRRHLTLRRSNFAFTTASCRHSFKVHSKADSKDELSGAEEVSKTFISAPAYRLDLVPGHCKGKCSHDKIVFERMQVDVEVSGKNTKADTIASREEEPIWVRRERERELQKNEPSDLPFGVYLLSSAIVAIAAVGSIFEYANNNPVFNVVYPDSPLYVPILAIFALTGLPTSGYLFYKAVSAANKEAERMDKLDGY